LCLSGMVWFCERERERRKQEKNIIFIIKKKNPLKWDRNEKY
jgi:hypothetical protein